MKLRIRGPSGQSTVTLDDSATVETLKKSIAAETLLSSFDVKYGYPPKPLDLAKYPMTELVTNLDVKLHGEQLIISATEALPSKSDTLPASTQQTQRSGVAASKGVPSSTSQRGSDQQLGSPSRTSRMPKEEMLNLTKKELFDPPEIFVPDLGGNVVLRIMPDDNSCLFRAISSAVMSDMDAVTELRSIVAQAIQADPETYTKAVLDNKEPDRYCRWIQSSDSWGGQVELLILSQYFQTEIFSIDVQSLRVDRYNEGAPRRCFVVYSGIHYDTIALSIAGMAPEDDVKQFESPINEEVMPHAIELCRQLQAKHYYTDTAVFSVTCKDCGTVCTGEKGATEHAARTGHYNFGEAA